MKVAKIVVVPDPYWIPAFQTGIIRGHSRISFRGVEAAHLLRATLTRMAAAARPGDSPKYIVVALDIESTGAQCLPHAETGHRDAMFSVGAAVYDAAAADPQKCLIEQHLINLDLHKPADVGWAAFWEQNGWERRCHDEFWSKNIPILEKTQAPSEAGTWPGINGVPRRVSLVSTPAEVADAINELLRSVEERWPAYVLATDTADYDFRWISNALEARGHRPLAYTRGGTYRWWARDIHKGSYLVGRSGHSYLDNMAVDVKPSIEAITSSFTIETKHTHCADEDAADIGAQVVAAIRYGLGAPPAPKRIRSAPSE